MSVLLIIKGFLNDEFAGNVLRIHQFSAKFLILFLSASTRNLLLSAVQISNISAFVYPILIYVGHTNLIGVSKMCAKKIIN